MPRWTRPRTGKRFATVGLVNFLWGGPRVGDQAFFYNFGITHLAIVAITKIARAGGPDETAFDFSDPYHDPSNTPRTIHAWYRMDMQLIKNLRRVLN